MKKNTLLLVILAFFTVLSCRIVPFEDVSLAGQSEWAVPLIDSKKSVSDLVKGFDKEAFLQIAPDGLLVLHYKGNFIAQSSLDIFSNLQNLPYPLTDTATALPFQVPNGIDIDYVDAKRGQFILAFRGLPNEVLMVTMKIPQMTNNGLPFTKTFSLTQLPYLETIELAGWHFEPANGSINIIYDARRMATNERINLSIKENTDKGSFTGIQIKDFQFSLVKGYFGKSTFDSPRDTIEMDFIKNLTQGEIRFEEPKMTLTLDNSFGIPVRAISKIAEVLTVNGQHLALKSVITEGIDINYPSINEIGKSKKTVFVLDKNNSNLVDIISSNPRAIDYDIDGITNAAENRSVRGFMTDSSFYKLQVEVDLPIHGSAKNFTILDTFAFDIKKYDKLTNAALKIVTDNGLPVDIGLQGFFVSANGAIIDSFYSKTSPLVLKGAPVAANGLPTSIQRQESLIDVDTVKLKKIVPASKIVVRLTISTTNNGTVPVKLIKTQEVRVQVGLKFGVKQE
jgi:hypothetical protein